MNSRTKLLPLEDIVAPTIGTRFHSLRAGQIAALQQYADGMHAHPDIAIELPTGAGKTLIALLILDYQRRNGAKGAILTGNKLLARQIESEAAELNVPIVRFEGSAQSFAPSDLRRYRRAQAIAVMNYWNYINQNPAMEAADYLVLDDAQLAEGALMSLYAATISKYAHPALFGNVMRLI